MLFLHNTKGSLWIWIALAYIAQERENRGRVLSKGGNEIEKGIATRKSMALNIVIRTVGLLFLFSHLVAAQQPGVWLSSRNPSNLSIPCGAREIVLDTSRVFALQDCNTDVSNATHDTAAFSQHTPPSLPVLRAFRKITITATPCTLIITNSTVQTITYERRSAPSSNDTVFIQITASTILAAQTAVQTYNAYMATLLVHRCRVFLADGGESSWNLAVFYTVTSGREFEGGSTLVMTDSLVVIRAHFGAAEGPSTADGRALIGNKEVWMNVLVSYSGRCTVCTIQRSVVSFLSGNINVTDNVSTQRNVSVPEANGEMVRVSDSFSAGDKSCAFDGGLVVENTKYYCEGATNCVVANLVNTNNVTAVFQNVEAVMILAGPRNAWSTVNVSLQQRSAGLVQAFNLAQLSLRCRNVTVSARIVPLRGPLAEFDASFVSQVTCCLVSFNIVTNSLADVRHGNLTCIIPSESLPPGGLQSMLFFNALNFQNASSSTALLNFVAMTVHVQSVLCAPWLRWNKMTPDVFLRTSSHSVSLHIAAFGCMEAQKMNIIGNEITIHANITPQVCSTAPDGGAIATATLIPILPIPTWTRMMQHISVVDFFYLHDVTSSTVLNAKDIKGLAAILDVELFASIESIAAPIAELGVVRVTACSVVVVGTIAAPTTAADLDGQFIRQLVAGVVTIRTATELRHTAVHITGSEVVSSSSNATWSQLSMVSCILRNNISVRIVGPPKAIAFFTDFLVLLVDVQQAPSVQDASRWSMTVSVTLWSSFTVRNALVVANYSNASVMFRFTNISYQSHRLERLNRHAPLIHYVDGTGRASSATNVTVSCVERDGEGIFDSDQDVVAPQNVLPMQSIRIEEACKRAVTAASADTATSVFVVVAVGYVVPQASAVSFFMLQTSQRALALNARCALSETIDAADPDDDDSFMSSVLDNPLQLRYGGDVPPSAAFAIGSIFGNACFLVGYATIIFAVNVAFSGTVKKKLVLSRKMQLLFQNCGGFVSSYLVPYWALAQPIATAAAGLATFVHQKKAATNNASVVMVVAALIGFAVVLCPPALWLHRVLWVWRGDGCPYRQEVKRLPTLTKPHPRSGLLAVALYSARLVWRRVLYPRNTKDVWISRKASPPTASDKQYLAVVSQYSVRCRWFLAVDIAATLLSGVVGGVAGAVSDCTWSLWLLLVVAVGQCALTVFMRPLQSRKDGALSVVFAFLGILSIALSVASDDEAAENVALVLGVVCSISSLPFLVHYLWTAVLRCRRGSCSSTNVAAEDRITKKTEVERQQSLDPRGRSEHGRGANDQMLFMYNLEALRDVIAVVCQAQLDAAATNEMRLSLL